MVPSPFLLRRRFHHQMAAWLRVIHGRSFHQACFPVEFSLPWDLAANNPDGSERK
jgi:hypothetical protein